MIIVNGKLVTVNMPPCAKKRLLQPVGQQPLNPVWNWGKARCPKTVHRADVSKEVPPTWLKVSGIGAEPKETPEPEQATPPRSQPSALGRQSKAYKSKSTAFRYQSTTSHRQSSVSGRQSKASVQTLFPPSNPPAILDDGEMLDVKIQCSELPGDDSFYRDGVIVRNTNTQTDLSANIMWEMWPTVKAKMGVTLSTQVNQYELMDMDREFSVTIEVATHRLLEDAALRLLYEEDLEALRRKMDVLHLKRVVKHMAVKRLEYLEAKRRRRALIALKKAERRIPLESTFRRIQCRITAGCLTARMIDDVLDQLVDHGFLIAEREYSEILMEEVSNQFVNHCQHRKLADAQMDALIRDVIVNRA